MPILKMPKHLKLELEHLLFIVFAAYIFIFHSYMGADYYWHLAAGEYLKEHGVIPAGDPFSFTFAGEPWVMHEWLFEIGLYQIYSFGGHYGVKMLTAVLMTMALFISYRAAVAISGSRSHSFVLTSFTLLIFYEYSLPRPQLLTYIFLAIYAYVLFGHKYRTHSVKLYWLPVIMVFWVNMHAGYLIGIALLGIYILLEAVGHLLEPEGPDQRATLIKPLFWTLLLCLAASLLNPYTYNQWIYPFQVMSMTVTDIINEWKSPNFHMGVYKGYLLYFLGFFFLHSYSSPRPDLSGTALSFFFIMLSLVSARHVPLALLITLPHYAYVTRNLHLPWRKQGFFAQKIIPWFASFKHSRLNTLDTGYKGSLVSWAILIALLPGVAILHQATKGRLDTFDNWAVPDGAVTFIKENGITGNILNGYGQGGYLIFKLYPQSKVFIDGRADLYGDKFIINHKNMVETRDGWQKNFARYNIDYVLLSNSTPLLWPLNASNDFKLVYRDEANSVLVRNTEKFKKIIDKYGKYYDSHEF